MPSNKPGTALSKADLDFMSGTKLTTDGVSKEVRLFSYLIDPFAEGSKFTPINKTSDSEPDTTGIEAKDDGDDGGQSQGNPAVAVAGATEVKTDDDAEDEQSKSELKVTTPKKRGANKGHTDVTPAKKTRGIAVIKKPVKKTKKYYKALEEEETSSSPEPSGPKARKIKKDDAKAETSNAKANKGKAVTSFDGNATEPNSPESVTTKGSPRKRAAPSKSKAVGVTLSSSMETITPQDKLILDMKAEGKTWTDIRIAYEALTGTKIASSTLPNRFARLKSKFTVFHEEDLERLKIAEAEVEKEHQQTKWSKVYTAMEAKGTTEKYSNLTLQKKFSELRAAARAAARDNDSSEDEETETGLDDAEARVVEARAAKARAAKAGGA